MKNIISITLFTLLIGFGSMAQNPKWIGGTLNINSTQSPIEETSITIMPQIGINVKSNLAVGGSLGLSSKKTTTANSEIKINVTSIIPFARYYISKPGKFGFFAQSELPVSFYNEETNGNDTGNYTSVGLLIKPGLGLSISEKWGLTMLMPSVLDFVSNDGENNVSFGINNGYNIQDYILNSSIGLIYKF